MCGTWRCSFHSTPSLLFIASLMVSSMYLLYLSVTFVSWFVFAQQFNQLAMYFSISMVSLPQLIVGYMSLELGVWLRVFLTQQTQPLLSS